MHTTSRSKILFSALVFIAAALTFFTSFTLQGHASSTAPGTAPIGGELHPAARGLLGDGRELGTPGDGETVRVVVEVSPGKPGAAESIQAYRNRVAAVQDRVVRRLDGRFAESGRLTNLPFLILEVDRTALAGLRASSDVANVYEDRMDLPTLIVSVPHVGGDGLVNRGFDGSGWSVAILDTGVDPSHPAFAGRIVAEACFSSTYNGETFSVCPNGQDQQTGPGAARPCDAAVYGCDHGTHVAGIAAGRSQNGSGVAPGAGIVAVQVFSARTQGCANGRERCAITWSSDQIRALDWVYSVHEQYHIAAVNMSLGGGRFEDPASCDATETARKRAIDQLLSAGVITVVAAGNQGMSDALSAPACISSAVSVGATTNNDTVTDFSNSASFLDLLAPGDQIAAPVPGAGFGVKSGTSMAAPHVAGAIALLRSAAPGATGPTIVAALKSTGIGISDARNGVVTPRIRVDAAFSALTGQVVQPGPAPAPAPRPNPAPAPQPSPSPAPQPQPQPTGIANDEWYGATVVTNPYFAEVVNTASATAGDDPYVHATPWCEEEGYFDNSVWYAFTAPTSGFVWASTFGSNYDTVLAVFDGDAEDWVQLGCVDDDYYPYNLGSTISGWIPAGTTLLIQVSAWDEGGLLAFQLAFVPDNGWGYGANTDFEAASALRP